MADCTVNLSAFSVVSTQLPRWMAYLTPMQATITFNAVTFDGGAANCTVNLSAFSAAATSKATTPAVDIETVTVALVTTSNAVVVVTGTQVDIAAIPLVATMSAVTVTVDADVSIAALVIASTMLDAVASGDCDVSPGALAVIATMQAVTVEVPVVANATPWAVWSMPIAVTVTVTSDVMISASTLAQISQMLAATVSAEIGEYPPADDSSLRYSVVLPTERGLATTRRIAETNARTLDRATRLGAKRVTDNDVLRGNVAMLAKQNGCRTGTVARTIRSQ